MFITDKHAAMLWSFDRNAVLLHQKAKHLKDDRHEPQHWGSSGFENGQKELCKCKNDAVVRKRMRIGMCILTSRRKGVKNIQQALK